MLQLSFISDSCYDFLFYLIINPPAQSQTLVSSISPPGFAAVAAAQGLSSNSLVLHQAFPFPPLPKIHWTCQHPRKVGLLSKFPPFFPAPVFCTSPKPPTSWALQHLAHSSVGQVYLWCIKKLPAI